MTKDERIMAVKTRMHPLEPIKHWQNIEEKTMKGRPILFSGEMVRAILDGRKTQTRRVIKPQPADDIKPANFPNPKVHGWMSSLRHQYGSKTAHICPYGQIGDLLWVREKFSLCRFDGGELWYWADGSPGGGDWTKPKPSIFMPRWASRITLEITDVRVERVQDISNDDALAEGIDRTNTSIKGYARQRFEQLWASINGNASWDANPWVWVIEFQPRLMNVDELLAEYRGEK